MPWVIAAWSVIGLLSTRGILPDGLEIGQSPQAVVSALPTATLCVAPAGAFALAADISLLQRPFHLTVYGRRERVTDINLTAQHDESGEAYTLLSDRLIDTLGPADFDGSGENIRAKTWTRDGVTVSVRRVLDKNTDLSVSDQTNSVFRLK